MSFQVSPGVAVKEIDLSTVIPAVSTSIGGFVGSFEWGPVDEITLVSSEDRLSARFGAPSTLEGSITATDFLTAAAFLSYTNALKTVRVVSEEATNATSEKYVKLTFDTAVLPDVINQPISVSQSEFTDGVEGDLIAEGFIVSVELDETNPSLKVATTLVTFGDFVVDVDRSTPENGAVTSVGGVVVLQATDPATSEPKFGPRSVEVLSFQVKNEQQVENNPSILSLGGTFSAKYPGAYGNSIEVVVLDSENFKEVGDSTDELFLASSLFDGRPGSNVIGGGDVDASEIHVVVYDRLGVFTGTEGSVLETYAYVSKNPTAKKADGSNNYFVDVINLSSSFVNAFDSRTANVSGVYSLSGGKSYEIAQSVSLGSVIQGWDLFKDPDIEDVNLLVVGSTVSGSDLAGLAQYVTQNICEVRKDCVAFISPNRDSVVGNPSPLSDVLEFRRELNLNSSYGFLDSGWKYTYNKYADRYEFIPLCGDTAGLCARTDSDRDPWYSPAGYNRGNVKGVIRLAYSPDQADRDELYKAGVNPIVNFRGVGPVLFGDKTLLVRPSAFDRINVRRLFIVLEKAIATAAKFSLFEFNDQFTRAQFVSLVEPFLRQVQSRRGIFDFRVVCDETNNTPQVIDSNQFVGSIFIKPARSINFITLNFVAVRTGVDFSEIVGSV